MTNELVEGADLPITLGPYSPAVKVGDLVFVSGQAGVDPVTKQVPDGGFEAECRQAFSNLAKVLKSVDADLDHIVKTTVLYADPALLPVINAVYTETFPVNPPARTAAIVRLAGGRQITVDAIAVVSR
ncbi:RidA family protein [Nocardia amamiensis]|uniref:RidA family protein n=1 Tax=Nocardia amamiensis TaxID=404578 RepID=UPI000836378F|nr:RidA family protein [Nocardia amamiensis]